MPLYNPDAGGDVVGPALSTDNAIPRFDGTTGKLIQDSNVTIDDNGQIVSLTNGATGGLALGSDTNLYRSAIDVLKTDDSLYVGVKIGIGSPPALFSTLYSSTFIDDHVSAEYYYAYLAPSWRPTVDLGKAVYGVYCDTNVYDSTATGNLTGLYVGGFFRAISRATTRNVGTLMGGQFVARNLFAGTVTNGKGGNFSLQIDAGTITNGYGAYIANPIGAGTLVNNYGIYLEDQAKGATNNYGIYLAGTSGLARQGIWWNGDTNIYRKSANTLKTGNLVVDGLEVSNLNGVLSASGGKVTASSPSNNGAAQTSVGFTQPTNPTPNDLWVDTGSGTSTGRGRRVLSAMFMGRRGGSNFFSKQLGAPLQARRTIANNWFFGESSTAAMKLWNGSSWITVT